ncbi:hypothetical protein SUDANB6_03960 [Streptomyces sp. enrichment culture]
MTTVTDTPGGPDAPDISGAPGLRGAAADLSGRARARFEGADRERTRIERGTQPQ